jgi:hypothetical protein
MGKDRDKYEGDMSNDNKFAQSEKSKTVKLTFQENRKFELHIFRNVYIFYGHETKDFPASILDEPDFKQHADKFSVTY